MRDTQPTTASEDFGSFGTEWQAPSVFWFVGGTDPEVYAKAKQSGTIADLPTNHNPPFAPVIHPTLEERLGWLWSLYLNLHRKSKREKSPVVYTCGVCVSEGVSRAYAVVKR